jgi:hypothetical protein
MAAEAGQFLPRSLELAERIPNAKPREPGEITVRGPQFARAVFQEEGGDVRVVNQIAGCPCGNNRLAGA